MKGSFEGLKGYAVGRMTKSHRNKLYIDDVGWGPEAGSIEYGYRVPFGGNHVFGEALTWRTADLHWWLGTLCVGSRNREV